MRKLIGLILLPLILVSCSLISFQGSFPGLVSDFKNVKENSDIRFIRYNSCQSICGKEFPDSSYVVVLNGIQLRNCVKKYPKAVVYVWKCQCNGELCYPLEMVQQLCDSMKLELFVVAEYFSKEKMSEVHEISHPQLAIDFNYYQSNLTAIYVKKFVKDLTKTPSVYKDSEMRRYSFFYFENGEFVRAFDNIESL